ncbi:hypothetical protein Q9R34_19505 [Enterobacter sp. BRE11]|nr:hypothetical protein [Enterobacter sp. BRE11]
MNDIFGRNVATELAIDKTVLAYSDRKGVQLLDCGEEHVGRYEVVVKDVLVACTDSYKKARTYYFREMERISTESQATFNAKLREAESAGLSGYLIREYAIGRITLAEGLKRQNTPCGIPIEEMP